MAKSVPLREQLKRAKASCRAALKDLQITQENYRESVASSRLHQNRLERSIDELRMAVGVLEIQDKFHLEASVRCADAIDNAKTLLSYQYTVCGSKDHKKLIAPAMRVLVEASARG